MAQRAIIGINGELTPFDASLDKISTPGIGAGSVTWVPDADTRCTSLKVTANGTYNAAQRGDYGYDYVTVSVPGTSVTGRDPDTGEEKQVTVNPETGEIEETVLPTEIRVTTPPAKTDYADGETIDYSGIVVHAYSSTGTDLGEVPFSELVFPVSTADAQQTDEWTDGAGLNALTIYYVPTFTRMVAKDGTETVNQVFCHTTALGVDGNGYPCTLGAWSPATLLVTRYDDINYVAGLAGDRGANLFSYVSGTHPNYGDDYQVFGWLYTGGSSAPAGDRTFAPIAWNNLITDIPVSTVNPTTIDPTTLHATQSLPVQWPRTGDGAILETSFNINVTGGDST